MDKSREPLISFRWRKDADGYTLNGEKIVRRGGRMVEYDPASVRPVLHHVFAGLHSQEDVPSAMLAFVSEYGFLGSDRSGADAESEDLSYLIKQSDSLHALVLRGAMMSAKGWRDGLIRQGDHSLTGPNVRMTFAPGSRGRMQVHYEPESLYAWMWLRTADDLTTGVDWSGAPCLYCLEQMGRGPGAHRRDAKFCSDKHRTYFDRLPPAEQRKRRKRAAEITRGQGAADVDGGG